MSNEIITVVDQNDQVVGSAPRSEVHRRGLIHRMIKVIIANTGGDILIQQRAASLESALKWDLSVAGHVDEGEEYVQAALRETQEEVGLSGINLRLVGKYYYERSKDGLTLRRFNTVYKATSDKPVTINPAEVAQVQWITVSKLQDWVKHRPSDFTTSFREIVDRFGL